MRDLRVLYETVVEGFKEESFDPRNREKKESEFRNYENGPRQVRVENFYKLNHIAQTYEFVEGIKKRIFGFSMGEMSLWEAFEMLDQVVDDSDPDTNLTQLQHGLQTAESLRVAYPDQDWLHLTGLIHDLGKVLALPPYELPQWAVVGDTFPVGCKHSDKVVFAKYFAENPDSVHPIYSTEYGVYEPHCGFENVQMSFGHDEYMYQVLLNSGTTLPPEALYVIRFHSFYAWHKEAAYSHLANEHDHKMLKWVHAFNSSDLYSKSHDVQDYEALTPYYRSLVEKYVPPTLKW